MAQSVFEMLNRRTVRAEVNPADKTTIVSIAPFDIVETITTVQPSRYEIPKGSLENPSLTVIGPASWWKETDPDQPLLEVIVGSVLVAKNLIYDYISAMNCVTMTVAQPGLFHVPGVLTLADVKKNFGEHLKRYDTMQRAWYKELVNQADGLWARTNQNPLSIDNQSRLAARELQLERPWIRDFQSVQNVNCIACGNLRNPQYPICPSCHMIVDTALAAKLGIVAAPSVTPAKTENPTQKQG